MLESTTENAARTPIFFRITVGLLVTSALVGAAAALYLVHEATNIDRAGGWGWIMVGAIFMAATTVVCLACAICTAVSLRRRESHRKASIVILVVSCLILLAFGPGLVHTAVNVVRQLEEEARVAKLPPRPPPVDSIGRSPIPDTLVQHFRARGIHLRAQGRFPNRETEWIVENTGVGPRCDVVVSFAYFWRGASVEAIRKELMAVSTPSVINEHEKMAMFHPFARGKTSDITDCEGWPAKSREIIEPLSDAFRSYGAKTVGEQRSKN